VHSSVILLLSVDQSHDKASAEVSGRNMLGGTANFRDDVEATSVGHLPIVCLKVCDSSNTLIRNMTL
jgi:hypothetical protein